LYKVFASKPGSQNFAKRKHKSASRYNPTTKKKNMSSVDQNYYNQSSIPGETNTINQQRENMIVPLTTKPSSGITSSLSPSIASESRSLVSSPQKSLQGGRRSRGIPRCDAIYGKEELERQKEYECFRQSRYQELQRLSQTEELQRGGRLPTIYNPEE
jgi:hypothetical protein